MLLSQENSALPQDAESMAASIKALARSVHGNTSEIFGELPQPSTRARVISAHSGTARS
jgi:Proline-rich AKT1 substrate 1